MRYNNVRQLDIHEIDVKLDSNRRRKKYAIFGSTFVGIIAVGIIILVSVLKFESNRLDSSIPITKTGYLEKYKNRLNCLPEINSNDTEDICKQRPNCVYDPQGGLNNDPKCYYDTSRMKYKLVSEQQTGLGKQYLIESSAHPEKKLVVEFEFLTKEALRFKITLQNTSHYEVPIDIRKIPLKAQDTDYDVEINNDKNDFSFKIIRKSTKTAIWDTSIGGLIFNDQQIQIATILPSKNVYGFGENNHRSFRHDFTFKSWPIFTRDQIPAQVEFANLYAAHPFYTCIEDNGYSHGVALINSNALEYELIPEPALIYRVTGGILDFYTFVGPHPENVIQQYTDFVGRPFMPPYWALGFQVSRYGYEDLDDMKRVLDRFKKYEIPLDTQVADIDHYDQRKIFTVDPIKWKGLDEYFDELHAQGMKTIILIDPFLLANDTNYLPFKRGMEKNVFITWPDDAVNPDYVYTNSSIMLGYCWPRGRVAYPDFLKKSAQDWWIDEIDRHHKTLKFDGIWIDMNEPAVFGTNEERPWNWPEDEKPYWSLKCPDNKYENVVTKASYLYRTGNKLSDKTLCMTGRQGDNNEYMHYDVHNLYGWSHAIPSYEAAQLITNSRGLVISRSSFIGSGKYAGTWTGDNDSKWSDLHYSIIGMLEFNLFGVPYVGADICGFWYNATNELCQRWSQLGAFYPFSRNHNGEKNIHQDPGALSEEVALAAKKALDIRYEILPYYYTLFYKAHTRGNTVIRPLFHEYPKDSNSYDIDKQFLVGDSFLVSPVLTENTKSLKAYFPKDNWYSYYDGSLLRNSGSAGEWIVLDTPLDHIPLHIRGGHIIATQEPANTTFYSRKNPFGLIVALNEDNEAEGSLYYDDGESKLFSNGFYYYSTFKVRSNSLQMFIEHNNYEGIKSLHLNKIRLMMQNVPENIDFVINDKIQLKTSQIEVNKNQITLKNLNLPMNEGFKIDWYSYGLMENHFTETIIDCSIENRSISENDCKSKMCQYDSSNNMHVPKCFIPKNRGGYVITGHDSNNHVHYLKKADNFSLYYDDIENLVVEVSSGRTTNNFPITRVKIFDDQKSRYEVPIQLQYSQSKEEFLKVFFKRNPANNLAYIEVRSKDDVLLFDTKNTEHGFIYGDQFIQIILNTHYKNVYGFGENNHYSFKQKFEYSNFWPIFARDQPTGDKWLNFYGTHPFFMAINENSGRAYGLLILNSNAMEYGFLPPSAISYRTLGGILDLYIMEEDSPEKLIQAYTSLIGKPYMPPYWSLGFQLCRYGYDNLDNLKAAVERTLNARIPLDVQYADIDHYRDRLDFTYDTVNYKGLPEYIKYLNESGVRFIIILDPAIDSEAKDYSTFDNGLKNDVWIKWKSQDNPQKNEMNSNGTNVYMLGYVWPDGKTVFPDFFLNRTQKWWEDEIVTYFKSTLTFDGLWIDMNEPANFDTNKEKPWNWPSSRPSWNLHCPISRFDDPPYLPLAAKPHGNIARLSDKTLCMAGVQNDGEYLHYDVHNLYGHSETLPTLNALRKATNLRGIVISRSTYVSSGAISGHWLGDNTSRWKDVKLNLIGLLEFNLFGIPYIGADICGFMENTTPELCQRWMQLGAFNTYFRNHNGKGYIDQDPASLGVDVAYSSRKVTEIRYSLLPYLYTLFYLANRNGGTVIRSLVHEFPSDKRAVDVDEQFLWGSSLLISPVLRENTRIVNVYFPKARWFDFYTGNEIEETGRAHELDAPLDHILLHIRGGSILVTQAPAMNTRLSRTNPFGLVIAPHEDFNNESVETILYWDGGEEIDPDVSSSIIRFTFRKDANSLQVKNSIEKNNYKMVSTNTLKTIRILGQQRNPSNATINFDNKLIDIPQKSFDYNDLTKELIININENILINQKFEVNIQY